LIPPAAKFAVSFLHAINTSAMEIHHELCRGLGPKLMSEGAVRHGCRMLKDGKTDVHDVKHSGGHV
jgi:hypothetical protein